MRRDQGRPAVSGRPGPRIENNVHAMVARGTCPLPTGECPVYIHARRTTRPGQPDIAPRPEAAADNRDATSRTKVITLPAPTPHRHRHTAQLEDSCRALPSQVASRYRMYRESRGQFGDQPQRCGQFLKLEVWTQVRDRRVRTRLAGDIAHFHSGLAQRVACLGSV